MTTTEATSNYDDLQEMTVEALLCSMNKEDQSVPQAVAKAIPAIVPLVEEIAQKMNLGGRLFYIGAGTSGRLGVVDASEIPPTYGLPHDRVIGIMAGGDDAIRKSVENAEDDKFQAWKDLEKHGATEGDVLIGVAASGRTPYVLGGVQKAMTQGLTTACVVCNQASPIAHAVKYPIEVVVGPEFVTGSTRMKAGTATKLVLNMISTSVMIKLGHVKGNKMVDMQLSNAKLIDRAINMLMGEIEVDRKIAERLIGDHGSVREAIDQYKG
ncbi:MULTISPECIES: N-acetylmuramic acid 6-phosphate etherase [Reichenbachiella]|uniref:N-acetylmuramic acid 6-phosphate etherase n=1 Tax=Reichenbachiella agariperforans TaxID=156994 RepID=A0A1M6VL38_REIAG|nr:MULTISPECIES: N-acetylmuramic acid 6-phosphate etherase [Reichenbachiella]MBU2914607.1 N-acetylmuramic acid 6-phosphate etherase [Reichenbachiella agariperforans]RJE75316.1 N-acetylmuramic acid 6-phosphate etherase [Reichenbachiella sp. MSK19-1]SHK82074.1 N-acetylmuramic acid 6-phosphate etherase [Reichenbachiella agariperforans]